MSSKGRGSISELDFCDNHWVIFELKAAGLREVEEIVAMNSVYTDWASKTDMRAELEVDVILNLNKYDYPPFPSDEVVRELFEKVENLKVQEKLTLRPQPDSASLEWLVQISWGNTQVFRTSIAINEVPFRLAVLDLNAERRSGVTNCANSGVVLAPVFAMKVHDEFDSQRVCQHHCPAESM